jgi:nitronate monooxygenase
VSGARFPTALCDLLGIRHPILLAGMAGGPTTPELVAAVSRAGGLGTFGAAMMTVDALTAAVGRARELTDAPIGVNVLLAKPTPPVAGAPDPAEALAGARAELGVDPAAAPPAMPAPGSPEDLVAAALEAGARAVTVGLGDPAPIAPLARAAGAPLIAMVATVEDAVRAVASGADAVVAQGAEAGGHRSNFEVPEDGRVPLVGTFALVPQVVRAVDVPVVAAGGIMDGRGLVAALALGASGVQLGTRFLLAAEAGTPAAYRERLRRARDTDTVITRAISGRPARGVRNRLVDALEAAGPPALGYPAQTRASATVRAAAAKAGDAEHMALWAGQAAGLAEDEPGAEEVVRTVMEEAAATLAALADAGGAGGR